MYNVPENHRHLGSYRWRTVGIGLIAIVVISFFCTQQIAAYYRFAPFLGAPLVHFPGGNLYQPFAWALWLWRLPRDTTLYAWSFAVLGGTIVVTLCAAAANAHSRRKDDNLEALHGSARWATFDEVKATGLLNRSGGVYVGGYLERKTGYLHYLQHKGPEHVLAFAPARSGKGAGLVIPTLLAWDESTIVFDIRGEGWDKTSGFRSALGPVLKFAPTEVTSSRFNPLREIRLHTHRDVSDAQNIAQIIVEPTEQSSGGDNRYFYQAGASLTTGLILHACYTADERGLVASFEDVYRLLHKSGDTFADSVLPELLASPHQVVRDKAQEMKDKYERDLSGVLSTTRAAFALFADPMVCQNTSSSDFRVKDLMDHEKPVSLYLVIPPADVPRLQPLIRLVLSVIVGRLTQSLQTDGPQEFARKHRLLLMIDEFPVLGRLEIFRTAFSYLGGYGITAYLIAQDIRQIVDAYGPNESIVSSCHIRIAFAPNQYETADLLSRMTGTRTIPRSAVTSSGNSTAPMLNQTSVATIVEQRPLLTPDEIGRIPSARKAGKGAHQRIVSRGAMLIFVAGSYPIYGTQILYFREFDKVLGARAAVPPPAVLPAIQPDGAVVEQPPINRTERVQSPPEKVTEEVPEDAVPDATIVPNTDDPFWFRSS